MRINKIVGVKRNYYTIIGADCTFEKVFSPSLYDLIGVSWSRVSVMLNKNVLRDDFIP